MSNENPAHRGSAAASPDGPPHLLLVLGLLARHNIGKGGADGLCVVLRKLPVGRDVGHVVEMDEDLAALRVRSDDAGEDLALAADVELIAIRHN